jgi:hypothetical protein
LDNIYDYAIDPFTKIYSFRTIYGSEFQIIFARDKSWFPYNPEFKDVFTFEIAAIPEYQNRDNKIKSTIIDIISKLFLENGNTIITYHCDNEDGRARARDRKFRSWHQVLNQDHIQKFDRQVIYQGHLIYSSLLIHINNPRFKRAVDVYYAGDIDVTNKFDID